MRKNINKQSGITLVALVIIMIVLLIIMGITFTALTGNAGILNQAMSSKDQTETAQIKEQVLEKYYEFERKNLTTNFADNNEKAEAFETRLKQRDDSNAEVTYKDQNQTFEITYKGHKVEIAASGKVTTNREIARKDVESAWGNVNSDSTLTTNEQKIAKLAEELGINSSNITINQDGTVTVTDYKGYTVNITPQGGETVVQP